MIQQDLSASGHFVIILKNATPIGTCPEETLFYLTEGIFLQNARISLLSGLLYIESTNPSVALGSGKGQIREQDIIAIFNANSLGTKEELLWASTEYKEEQNNEEFDLYLPQPQKQSNLYLWVLFFIFAILVLLASVHMTKAKLF